MNDRRDWREPVAVALPFVVFGLLVIAVAGSAFGAARLLGFRHA